MLIILLLFQENFGETGDNSVGGDHVPQTFFANVPNRQGSDPSGEFYWNPYKSTDELNSEVGPWDNDGPKHMREDEDDDHNHEDYLSGTPEPGDYGYFTPNNPTELKDAVNMWTVPATKEAALKQYGEINLWNVSLITDMSNLFDGKTTFNDDISNWDVGKVTKMSGMFKEARAFNQDIGGWDVRNVETMEFLFYEARAFNQDIGSWNVSKVTNMTYLFSEAHAFNQDIGSWDVSNVTVMNSIFRIAHAFNQDLSAWNTSKATTMFQLFYDARAFNQDISNWNVSNVAYMNDMFYNANALSDANKCAIETSFKAQNPSVWPYEWCTFTEITLGTKGTGKYAAANGDHPPAAAWTPWGQGPTVASGHNQFYAHPGKAM